MRAAAICRRVQRLVAYLRAVRRPVAAVRSAGSRQATWWGRRRGD